MRVGFQILGKPEDIITTLGQPFTAILFSKTKDLQKESIEYKQGWRDGFQLSQEITNRNLREMIYGRGL